MASRDQESLPRVDFEQHVFPLELDEIAQRQQQTLGTLRLELDTRKRPRESVGLAESQGLGGWILDKFGTLRAKPVEPREALVRAAAARVLASQMADPEIRRALEKYHAETGDGGPGEASSANQDKLDSDPLQDPSARGDLITRLQGEEGPGRVDLLNRLASYVEEPEVRRAFLARLQDEDPGLVVVALRALSGATHQSQVRAGLQPLLKHQNPDVARAAEEALGDADRLLARLDDREETPASRSRAVLALSKVLDREAVLGGLLGRLSDAAEDDEVRSAAAEVLGPIVEKPEVRAALLARLEDRAGSSPQLRATAAGALAGAADAPWVRRALLSVLSGESKGASASSFAGVRPTTELGLIGLAFSGGGIRSATFNLGLVQSLAKRGVLPLVDYMSTVSGGGYLGSCLSSLMTNPWRHEFPLGTARDGRDQPALRHLRNSGNYLATGLLDMVRIPALLLRGILLNLLVLLPYVVAGVWVCYWVWGGGLIEASKAGRPRVFWQPVLVLTVIFLVWVFLSPLVEGGWQRWRWRFRRGQPAADFKQRDTYERAISLLLLFIFLAILVVFLPSALSFYDHFISLGGSEDEKAASALASLKQHGWFMLGGLAVASILAALGSATPSKITRAAVFGALMLLGPGILLWVFLVLGEWCVFNRPLWTLPSSEAWRDPVSMLSEWIPSAILSPAMVESGWWTFTLLVVMVWFYLVLFVDVNTTSMHGFYRDRLSRAYLLSYRDAQRPAPSHRDHLRLRELGTHAPYHLLNVALNLQTSSDPDVRERQADFFFFSKRFVGGERTGYCATEGMDRADARLDLGTAMAISAAAAAPNMGSSTIKPLVFLMALFNVRLGYWLPNPAWVHRRRWFSAGVGPLFLVRELFGQINDKSTYVNLTDGGHLENLAVYELLRRRLKTIIVCDAEADPELRFGSLANVMRYAKIDLGIDIEIDLQDLRKGADGLSRSHAALGKIRYPARQGEPKGGTGQLVYIKLSVTGQEAETIREYRARNPNFPHESTGDQFFDEAQFESYRALGFQVGEGLFGDSDRGIEGNMYRFERWISYLATELRPQVAGDGVFVGLQDQLSQLERELLDPALAPYTYQVYPEIEPRDASMAVPDAETRRKIFHFCCRQLQLMENVVRSLNLGQVRNQKHHVHRGWMNLFRRWSRTPFFHQAWAVGISSYSVEFQQFCEKALGLRSRLVLSQEGGLSTEDVAKARKWSGGPLEARDRVFHARVEMGADGASRAFPIGFCVVRFELEDGLKLVLRYARVHEVYRGMGLFDQFLPALREILQEAYPTGRLAVWMPVEKVARLDKLVHVLERHGFQAEDNALFRLRDADPVKRMSAARELKSAVGRPEVRQALVGRLKTDQVTAVRVAAATALIDMGDKPEVLSALLTLLSDDNKEVLRAVARALGKVADHSEARNALLERLSDKKEDEIVRQAAAEALSGVAGEEERGDVRTALLLLLEPSHPTALRAAAARGLAGARDYPGVRRGVAGLLEDSDDVWYAAAGVFAPLEGATGSEVRGFLLEDLECGAVHERLAAIIALEGAAARPAVTEALLSRLGEDRNPEVRLAAIRALALDRSRRWPGEMRAQVASALVSRLQAADEYSEVRRLATEMLVTVSWDEFRNLSRRQVEVHGLRRAAVDGLADEIVRQAGEPNDGTIHDKIVREVQHRSPVGSIAARAMGRAASHPRVFQWILESHHGDCEDRDSEGRDSESGDPDHWMRRRALVEILAHAESRPKVIDELLTYLDDRTHAVRLAAAEALGRRALERVEVRDKELMRLRDPRPSQRMVAARALGGAFETMEIGALIPVLDDEIEEVRAAAAWGLAGSYDHPDVRGTLESRLRQRDDKKRISTCRAFAGAAGEPKVLFALLAQVQEDGDEVARALASAARRRSDVRGALLASLGAGPSRRRLAAARSLVGAVYRRDVRRALLPLLDDPSVELRLAVASALADAAYLPEVRQALIHRLHQERVAGVCQVLVHSVSALTHRDDVRRGLMRRLLDQDPEVGTRVAGLLRHHVDHPEVRAALEAYVEDESVGGDWRSQIVLALRTSKDQPEVDASDDEDDLDRPEIRGALLRRLGDLEGQARSVAIERLADQVEQPGVVNALLGLLEDVTESAPVEAIDALADAVGEARVRDVLLDLLGHIEKFRVAAARVLARETRRPEVERALAWILEDEQPVD